MNSLGAVVLGFAVCASGWGQSEVLVTGLQGPQKLLMTPQGNFLVSETSMEVNAGRISFVSRAGTRRSLFEGMPSGTEVAGGGSGPSAMALRDRTLYVSIGGGDTERRDTTGASIHNPAGISSPIYSSVLEVHFNASVDSLTGTFKMTPAQQVALSDGETVELVDGAGGSASVSVLVDFPNSIMHPLTKYKFSNPWGLALSADGATLWATDASQNSLVKINTSTGRWQRVVRFPALRNAGAVGPPLIDAVPTSVRIHGEELLVSFLTGFPFTPGYARVDAVDPSKKTSSPFIYGVSSAVDVLCRSKSDGSTQCFLLEFSTNQSAAQPPPGRLLRYDSPQPEVVLSDLRAPVSLAFDETAQELFILELSGRLLKLPVH
ncbi:MAG: ScyD/ScyE family protein [Bryobacteraceae bacterium]|nr:ScyD/ScyE family protein [Bryobacteraceae bacterium]